MACGKDYAPDGVAQICFCPEWKTLLAVPAAVLAAGVAVGDFLVPRKERRVDHRCCCPCPLACRNLGNPEQKAYTPWVIYSGPECKRVEDIQ